MNDKNKTFGRCAGLRLLISIALLFCVGCSFGGVRLEERRLLAERYAHGQMDKQAEEGIKAAVRAYLAGEKPADIEKCCVENKLSSRTLSYPMVRGEPWPSEIGHYSPDFSLPSWDIGQTWSVFYSGIKKNKPWEFIFAVAAGKGPDGIFLIVEGADGKYKVSDAFILSGVEDSVIWD